MRSIKLSSQKRLATPSAVIGATTDARKRALALQGSPFSMAWMDTSCLAMPLLRSFRWRHMSHPDSSCQPPAERPGHSANDYSQKAKFGSKCSIICIISLIKLGFISYSKKLSHWFSAYLGHDYHFPLGISENTHRLAVLVNWTSKR